MENLTVRREAVEMEIVIKFDVSTGIVSVQGCDKNPLVALGMLDYALARVRRFILQNDLQQELQGAPRVALASGLPQ